MAITIPIKAFDSFSFKQCVAALHKCLEQIDDKADERELLREGLNYFKKIVNSLQEHEDRQVRGLAGKLEGIFPHSPETLQNCLMVLERAAEMGLQDRDFLISTQDRTHLGSPIQHPVYLVLDNLRSSFNVGSLLRAAEALGVREVHLCGYTATPENAKTRKSALGTEDWITWKYWESTLECLDFLQKKDMSIYAFETVEGAHDLKDLTPRFPAVIVLGNERFGLSAPVLKRADYIVKIALFGKKNSLNVGHSGAIAMNSFVSKALSESDL